MSEFIPMKDLIDDDARDGIVSHCVFHCLATLSLDEQIRQSCVARGGVEAHLTFNGREVSLKKFLEEFERQYDYLLAKRAERLLDARMGSVSDALYDLEKRAKAHFRKLFEREDEA